MGQMLFLSVAQPTVSKPCRENVLHSTDVITQAQLGPALTCRNFLKKTATKQKSKVAATSAACLLHSKQTYEGIRERTE